MTRKFLYLNGLAILCVILFHAAGWGFTAMFSWAHRYLPVSSPDYSQASSPVYYALRLIEQLVVFSIPAFLFVSGYFVAFTTGKKPAPAWSAILARVKILLIPYLVWSVLILAANALQGRPPSLAGAAQALLIGSTYPSYYFVPLLIQFYLLAPLLVPLVRRYPLAVLLVTGLLQLTIHALIYPTVLGISSPLTDFIAHSFPKWFFPVRLFWFCAGIAAGFYLNHIKAAILRLRPVWVGLTTVLFAAGFIEWELLTGASGQPFLEMRETVVDALYAASFILMILSLPDSSLPLSSRLNDWGAKSFGIYLVHSPVMEYAARAIYHFLPALLGMTALFVLIIAVIGLAVPLALMAVVKRSPLSRWYVYLFG
jgi:peptidoglycan/LPS O-acetylase OafA/YrhL